MIAQDQWLALSISHALSLTLTMREHDERGERALFKRVEAQLKQMTIGLVGMRWALLVSLALSSFLTGERVNETQ